MHVKSIWETFKTAGSEFLEDNASRLGAALAYYTIFAMAPLIVIAIGIVGMIFSHRQVQEQITQQIQDLVGTQAGDVIGSMIDSASQPGRGVLGTLLGIIMLLVGATGLFIALQDALNTIWEVQPKAGRGIWGFIRDRFLSFSMVLGVAFLLMVSLLVSAALSAVVSLLGDYQTGVLGHVVSIAVNLVVLTLLFAMIYRFLPDAQVAWKDVWLGALFTTILFIVGKLLIGMYLGASGVGSAYGAAGSLAVLLIWLYYSAQIFLFGAELTQVYARHSGHPIQPSANAEHVTDKVRAEQGMPRSPSSANQGQRA